MVLSRSEEGVILAHGTKPAGCKKVRGNVFFLEHAGELRIIVLIEEERVIHRPKNPHTRTH
jgi:hypothetical protein